MEQREEKRFLKARQAVIESRFQNLNDMQLRAALATEGPLQLLAGAGSGKTTVLIHRVANLIRYGRASDSDEIPNCITPEDVDFLCAYAENPTDEDAERADNLCALEPAAPWNVIAITFTNKAANELKTRLGNMLGPEAQDVWAMTFHSACCRILRREIERLGYSRNFTIYDASDSEKVMKEIIRDLELDSDAFTPKSVLSAISSAKDQMLSPEKYGESAKYGMDFRAEWIGKAYGEYEKRLKEANALDFDDLILKAVQILQNYQDVREYYQRKFRYVLIDEYQDTNNLQYLLATLLSGRYENICVVGDDDQSIYKFRGATIANILNFEKQYPGARVIRLEQNYRSTKYILEAANAVIANNHSRKAKTLWTANPRGDRLTVYEAYSETDEANYISSQILSFLTAGHNFRDCAVLYRFNAQSNALEMSFQRNGIPYRIIGGTRFFDRAEIRDILAYLCLINNTTDDLRFKRIVNVPARGIGKKTLESVERQAAAANLPMYDVAADAAGYPALEKCAQKLGRFTGMIEELRQSLQILPLPDFYDELLEATGYLAMLDNTDDPQNLTRLENVQELKSSIISYVEKAEEPSLAGFLEEVSLYTDIDRYDEDADAAVMMTMHSAKGLEFPIVFLAGMEENLFPGVRVLTDESEMEEERRLCYVAITRAKERLFLTYTKQRMLYGRTSYNQASRFLGELPESCIEQSGRSGRMKFRAALQQEVSRDPVRPRPKPRPQSIAPVPELHKGDQVVHSAFGEGIVLNVMSMGGDALLEIAFDQVGTKKLMLKTASAHMHLK